MSLTIREDDLESAEVKALLTYHLESMRDSSPPECSFALDLSGLKAPGITVWTIWDNETLCGVGALKAIDGGGEIKSMRTHPDHLGKGVGATMLTHIIGEARARGYRKVSLETGTGELFEAALSLYRTLGFEEGEAFADYAPSDFNRFFHLTL